MAIVLGIFALIFGFLGWLVWRFLASEQAKKELSEKYPGEPWRWRPDWAEGIVRSGRSRELRLEPFPPSLGHPFTFTARVDAEITPGALKIELACLSTGSNSSNQTMHGEPWVSSSPRDLSIHPQPEGTEIRGSFDIPPYPEALASTPFVGSEGGGIYWNLMVKSPRNPMNYVVNFEIPVFQIQS